MTRTGPSLGLPGLELSSPGGLGRGRMEEQCTGLFQAPTAKKEEWVVSLILVISN